MNISYDQQISVLVAPSIYSCISMLRPNKLHNWNDNFGYRHFPDDNLWWCSEGKIALFQNKRTSNDIFPITHDYMYPHAGSQCMNSRLIKSIKWIIRGVSRVSWFAYYIVIVISKTKLVFVKLQAEILKLKWKPKPQLKLKLKMQVA